MTRNPTENNFFMVSDKNSFDCFLYIYVDLCKMGGIICTNLVEVY